MVLYAITLSAYTRFTITLSAIRFASRGYACAGRGALARAGASSSAGPRARVDRAVPTDGGCAAYSGYAAIRRDSSSSTDVGQTTVTPGTSSLS